MGYSSSSLYLMPGHVAQSNWLRLWTRMSLHLPCLSFPIYTSPFPSFFSILLLLTVTTNPSLEKSSPTSSALTQIVIFQEFVSFTSVSHSCSYYFLFSMYFLERSSTQVLRMFPSLVGSQMSREATSELSSIRDGAGYDEIFPLGHEPKQDFSWLSERETSA